MSFAALSSCYQAQPEHRYQEYIVDLYHVVFNASGGDSASNRRNG
jgi:hypothetical protein